jgi:hypothetical protein
MKRYSLIALLALSAFLAFGIQPASAGFLTGGNTFPSSPGPPGTGVDGHVNFAVFDTSGGSAGDTWGTGLAGFDAAFVAGILASPALDTTAKYLYLYQTVNDGSNANVISTNSVSVDAVSFVTSWGHFSAVGFTQTPPGTLTAAGGPYVGGTSAAAGSATVASPIFIGAGGGVAASGVAQTPTAISNTGLSIAALFFGDLLAAGEVSAVWGYTSNHGPIRSATGIIDGGTVAQGTVLVAGLPEPASLAVWAGLLSVAGLVGFRSRRAKRSA